MQISMLFRRVTSLCFSVAIVNQVLSFSTTPSHKTKVIVSKDCRVNSLPWQQQPINDNNERVDAPDKILDDSESCTRRSVLFGFCSAALFNQDAASAAGPFQKNLGLYLVKTRDAISDSVPTEQIDTPVPTLSSEYALLNVLPVNNVVFRTLQTNIEALSALRFGETGNTTWVKAEKSAQTALSVLSNKRSQLEPVFNPEDSTELSIIKGERGEILIEQLREELILLSNATTAHNVTKTFEQQQAALVTLGFLGELLVKEFPYIVPSKGRFSFLPRLLGRAKVTLRMKRRGVVLGNITIVADGYIAPITAGNFVDLCLRNFYTGLPLKSINKKFGKLSEQVSASIKVMGSFNEGFFDPLTGKLRRIPLEVIRLEKGSGQPKLSYSTRGAPDVLFVCKSCMWDTEDDLEFISDTISKTKPLLTFDAPGLVALNHPDKNPNGGSSEFFALQKDTMPSDKRRLLDAEYAPFGFIIEGSELYHSLQPDDIVDATFVDEFGRLNLVKIRESTFSEVAQGSENES